MGEGNRGGEGDGNADVEAEAVAEAVKEFAHGDFRAGVLAPDSAHVPASTLRR